jgi:hypothetical protein
VAENDADDALNPEPAPKRTEGFEMRQRDPEQPTLFPKDELVVPPTVLSLRKSVSIIQAVPAKAEHAQSLNGRRLFDACITAAQLDFRQREKNALERVINDRLSPLFEIRVGELSKLANIPGKNFERIYAELDRLFETSFRWNIIGEDSSVEFEMKAHFLSSVGYGVGGKKGLVRFSFDPSVLQMILDPKLWATLSFVAMEDGQLRTAASYALYQNTWRYVNTNAKVTAALPTETWIDLLVGPSRYVTEENGVRRATGYADFKRRVLMDAIRRVNEVRALSYTLELKEHKAGNRVARLQFRFIPKEQQSLGLPLSWPGDVLKFLSAIGLSDAEIKDIGEAHSYEIVADSIVRLREAEKRMREANKRITSRRGYFLGILANVAAGGGEQDPEEIERQVRHQEAQQAAEDRRQRSQDDWEAHRSQRFREGFWDLPLAQREALLQSFSESEEAQQAAMVLKRGLKSSNVGAMAILRAWLAKSHPHVIDQVLLMPEDRSFEAWLTLQNETASRP